MPRLGQLLVRTDLVSENNLARALGVQHFAGGRIGTLLLERGSLHEDDLGKALAQQHGCEYVPWKLLADIPPIVIAALPAKFAVKHAAIPYDRSESAIRLALRDPADLRILDELFFVTGRKIIAAVAPEVRIYQALEKYYGERRTPRYAILAEKLSRPARGSRTSSSAPPPPPQFFPEPERPPRPLPESAEIWGDAGDSDLSAPPIMQTWTVTEPKGGWAGTSSPKGTRPSGEVEEIAWEEMPPSPSLWSDAGAPEAIGAGGVGPSAIPQGETAPAARFARGSRGAERAPKEPGTERPPKQRSPERAPKERDPERAPEKRPRVEAPSPVPVAEAPALPQPVPPPPPPPEEPPDLPQPPDLFSAEPEEAEPSADEAAEAAAPVSSGPAREPEPEAPPAAPIVPTRPAPPGFATAKTRSPAPLFPAAPAATPAGTPARPVLPTAADFPEVTAAQDRDSIGAAVLASLGRRFPRAALFAARPDAVAGWASAGEVDQETIRRITIPWTDPSVFMNVRLSRSFYLGPLLQLPRHRELSEALGGWWPEECVVQPVLMKEKPVAFLFAVGSTEGIGPIDLVYLRELAETASNAFASAIRLKKKGI